MARYIYVFRKKMKGLEDHVEVSINPEASFQCSVDRRIIPDQWSRLVDYWHSAKFQCLGVLAHLFMYLPTVLLTSAAGAHSWDRLFCGWGTVLAKELFCRGPRQNSWEM